MVPATGPLSAQARHEIRSALEAHMKAAALSQADVADAVGTSATYINNLLTQAASLPAGTADRLWRDINNWIEREGRAAEMQRPDSFVRTRVAERLLSIAERLTERRPDMAIAFGPAGVGKTVCIEAICAEIPTAVAITAGYATRSPRYLLIALYAALTRRRRAVPQGLRLEDVAERLRMPPRVKTRSLLIVDQAHLLPDRVWPTLMELHDAAQCSILLVGTIDLKRRVATDDDPEFGQLSSRIGMRVHLAPELVDSVPGSRLRGKAFTVADIRRIFARSKLKLHPDAARLLAHVANTQRGCLRRVARLFDWAELAAHRAGRTVITVEDLRSGAVIVEADVDLSLPPEPTESAEAAAS